MTGHLFAHRLRSVLGAVIAAGTLLTTGLAGVAGASESVSISGTAQVFDTLTASGTSASSSATYAWYTCASSTIGVGTGASAPSTSGCTQDSAPSTTNTTYTVVAADYLQYVSVIMTDGSPSVYYWATTAQVTEPLPSVVANPTLAVVVGSNVVGSTASLTGTTFDVANPTLTTYQWYRCSASAQIGTSTSLASGCSGGAISGATGPTYQFTPYDYGYWVLAEETVTNAMGSATVYSASTTAAIGGTAPTSPTGQALGAMGSFSVALSNFGSWTADPAPTSYTVTWYRCSLTSPSTAGTSLPSGCSPVALGTTYPAATNVTSVVYTYASADIGYFLLAGIQAYNGLTTNVTGYTASTTAKVVAVAPTMTSPPAMTGTAAVGDTLSVSAGAWSGLPTPTITYAWWLCGTSPSWSSGSSEVGTSAPGAIGTDCTSSGTSTTSSYAPTAIGDFVIAQVIATNSANAASYFTAQTAAVTTPNFGTGTVTIAAANNGSYTSSVDFTGGTTQPTLAYIWEDCASTVPQQTTPQASNTTGCSPATGTTATAATYVTVSADMSKYLDLVVRATIASSSTYVWSATTGSALTSIAPTGTAAISGTGLLSTPESASATITAWPAAALSYQWYDCPSTATSVATCAVITGAGGASYTPSTLYEASLNGGNDYLGVLVTANNGVSPAGTAFALSASALTTQVPAIITYPRITVTPSATAVTTTSTLTASPGTWQGAPTPMLTYQWYACRSVVGSTSTSLAAGCTAVPGATGPTYTPIGGYVNDYFLVGVTGSNGVTVGGASTAITAYSSSTVYALVSTLSVSSVTITGTATVGSTLTASASVNSQGTYATSYQWYSCSTSTTAGVPMSPYYCTPIVGATGQSFVLTVNQVSDYVSVLVTVSANGTTATGTAASTALVTTNIPGAPTGVTAIAGAGQATVSWNAPSTGQPPTSYTVTTTPGGATCTATTSRTCVVTGLLYGTAYTFTVTASNVYGTSAASVASNAVYPTETVPSAPTTVSAVAGILSATVSWTAAGANGAVVSSYTVTSSPGGLTCQSTVTSCTVNGLTAGTTYTFTVMARNAVGPGPSSYQSPAITPRANVPVAPTGVQAKRGNGQLTISWTAGAANGSTVTGYVATATATSGSHYCQTTSATSCTVTGLTNGVQYHVSVIARSSGGSSLAGFGPAVVPAGRPSVPGIVRIVSGRGVVVVYLRAPSNVNGARIAYYQFLLNGQRWTVQSIKGRLFIRLLGLSGTHVIRVRAVSVGGASAASAPVRFAASGS